MHPHLHGDVLFLSMSWFNFNGSFFEEGALVIGPQNRGLRYGDGLFETLKCRNGVIILLKEHLDRLWEGMQKLAFDIPKLFTLDFISSQITNTLKKNKLTNARIRINVIRGNGGLFDAENYQPNFIIECWPLMTDTSVLNNNGLQLSVFKKALKPIDEFSNIKHNNFLIYSMAAIDAKSKKCNDAIVINTENNVCETAIANIFIFKEQQIYTPPLSQGCIAGIMRSEIILALQQLNITVIHEPIKLSFLAIADEIFLSNSIYNMRWVAGIEDHVYKNDLTTEIFNILQKTKPNIFC